LPVPKSDTKRYFLLHKPYGVLSQFTDSQGRKTLKGIGQFPTDVYSVGRLDMDSEGLLLLTNDNEVNNRLTDPRFDHARTYLVQIEGIPSNSAIEQLREGVIIQGKMTRQSEVRLLEQVPDLPARTPAIRERKTIPTAWVEITLREGRNRQVRKMTAAVGFPTLRLVRTKIGELSIGKLKPGESRQLSREEAEKLRSSIGL
jgi:23S rRNA pseudouridine2457 synthase